jgi:GntR family transcriptional regulator
MSTLNKISPIPLYHQLAQALRAQIRSGIFQPGAKFPPERELMQTYSVSRNTVRQAIDLLAREGLLQRDQGRGTFVTKPKLSLGVMRLTSFTEDMLERDLKPSSVLLQRTIEVPPMQVADALCLAPGEKTILIERLRLADGTPMALNTSYFALSICPGLIQEDVESQSIYWLLENRYGIRLARAEQTIRAASATQREADLLAISPGSPLLVIEGVAIAEDERRVEYLRSIYRSDRYEFTVNPIRLPI